MGLASAIGLGLAGAGAIVGSSSNRKAANKAANVSADNNAANVALARDIYGQNKQIISPFVQRGNAAGDQINALLGLAPEQSYQQPQVQPNALSQFGGYAGGSGPNQTISRYGNAGLPYGLGDGFIPPTAANSYAQTPTTQQSAANGFDTFRNSTGYQFRLNEGLDAVNSGYAGAGTLQSGAAMRAINDYAQNVASGEFGNYLNALGSQQAVGAGSASALAGVGQNFAGTVINSNNQNAANQANALIAKSQNNPLANFAGIVGGGLLGGAFG